MQDPSASSPQEDGPGRTLSPNNDTKWGPPGGNGGGRPSARPWREAIEIPGPFTPVGELPKFTTTDGVGAFEVSTTYLWAAHKLVTEYGGGGTAALSNEDDENIYLVVK